MASLEAPRIVNSSGRIILQEVLPPFLDPKLPLFVVSPNELVLDVAEVVDKELVLDGEGMGRAEEAVDEQGPDEKDALKGHVGRDDNLERVGGGRHRPPQRTPRIGEPMGRERNRDVLFYGLEHDRPGLALPVPPHDLDVEVGPVSRRVKVEGNPGPVDKGLGDRRVEVALVDHVFYKWIGTSDGVEREFHGGGCPPVSSARTSIFVGRPDSENLKKRPSLGCATQQHENPRHFRS